MLVSTVDAASVMEALEEFHKQNLCEKCTSDHARTVCTWKWDSIACLPVSSSHLFGVFVSSEEFAKFGSFWR